MAELSWRPYRFPRGCNGPQLLRYSGVHAHVNLDGAFACTVRGSAGVRRVGTGVYSTVCTLSFISGVASRPSLMQHSTLLCVTESRMYPAACGREYIVYLEHHARDRTVQSAIPALILITPFFLRLSALCTSTVRVASSQRVLQCTV